MSWSTVLLLEACENHTSGISEFEGKREYLSTGNLDFDKIIATEVITYDNRPSRANRDVEIGDIICARMQGTKKVLHIDTNDKANLIVSTGFIVLHPKESLLPKYLKYFLISPYFNKIKDSLCNGATQRAINDTNLNKIKIPLPSLPEQKRIVEHLEKLDILSKKKLEAEQLSRKMIQSIFLDMFGNSLMNQDKWDRLTLPQIVFKSKHAIKRGPFGGALKKEIFVDEGYLVYEQKHAIHEDFDFARYYITEEKYKELEMFKVVPGDLIISCSGVTLGRIAEIPKNAKPGIINQALLKISLDRTKVNNTYFKFLFRDKSLQDILFSVSRGSGIPNFPPISTIKKIKFPIPPLLKQQKFAEFVQKVEIVEKKQQESKRNLHNLFNALMQEVFQYN